MQAMPNHTTPTATTPSHRAGDGHDGFRTIATRASEILGSPGGFVTAVCAVVLWALAGPLFGFSSTWQLVINTVTTVVTFLMVFLVQHTQNRDSRSLHLKLDELLRATAGARTSMADLDELSDEDLARLENAFKRLARAAARGREAADEVPQR
jgi:low affinity Fe/Cu permease